MKTLLCSILALLAATAGALDCLVVPTLQDTSMDWWYRVPQGFTPKITPVTEAPANEYFRVVPFYKEYGLDTNSQAKITFDFELVRPDGTIDEIEKKVVAHEGKAQEPLLLPSRGILNICFDEDDPLGAYTIKITSVDHVAGVTNIQTASIEHIAFTLPKLSPEEDERVFTAYPTTPRPTLALASFLQQEQSFFNEENEPIWSAIWFYKTVFENNDYLLAHLLEDYSKRSNKQQRDIILVLALLDELDQMPRLSGDLKAFRRVMEAGRVLDPYDDITNPKQLDMLWAEFFATGTAKPVQQIMTSLSLIEHRGTLEKIQAGELNPAELEVYRAGMLEATFQSALWSIRTNCEKSPLLFQYMVGILQTGELEERAASTLALLLKSIQEDATKDTEHEEDH